MNQINKLANKLTLSKAEERLLIVCPITGIISTLDLPKIENFFLEQINPIASTANLFKLAELQPAILTSLEKPLLAGILLGLFKSLNLIDSSNTSSSEQNLLIQSVHPTFIAESIKFFSSSATINGISASRKIKKSEQAKQNDFYREEFPTIRISQKDECEKLPSSIQSVIRNYRKDCYNFLFAEVDSILGGIEKEVNEIRTANNQNNNNANRIAKAILAARRTAEGERKELLKEARNLNYSLFELGLINDKLNNFIKVLLSKDTLKTADSSWKERAVKALMNKNTPDATKLAAIIKHKAFISVEDSLFAGDTDIEIAETLADLPEEEIKEEKKKLSFKEIIELKRMKQAQEQATAKENSNESI